MKVLSPRSGPFSQPTLRDKRPTIAISGFIRHVFDETKYQLTRGRAKSSVTDRLPSLYPRYILKCFTALEWCVE